MEMETELSASVASAAPHDAVEDESSVLRYYTSQLMLRYVSNEEQAAAVTAPTSASAATASYLSILEPPTCSAASLLLMNTSPIVVVPTTLRADGRAQDERTVRGIFTVVPADGFEKTPGQPVYFNDPIQLVDSKRRTLGIATHSPCSGHLSADGHDGALVFVFERQSTQVSAAMEGNDSNGDDDESVDGTRAMSKVGLRRRLGLMRRQSTRSSLVEICGGEQVYIPGLMTTNKKQFGGTCVIQSPSQNQSQSRRQGRRMNRNNNDRDRPCLACEIVLVSSSARSADSFSDLLPLPKPEPTRRRSKSTSIAADRTALGEFVGVLHSGVLHRRAEVTKMWKTRFFVLTQLALHRFDSQVTLDTVATAKPRGVVLLKDCRRVRYEKFSRPHELDLELNSGKVLSLHSVDALTCSKWASVLSLAIDNPHWVHAERAYLTVWRSDARFQSPKCPSVTTIALHRDGNESSNRVVAQSAEWSEKLSLGGCSVGDVVVVHLSDGNQFHLSLDDLSSALLHSCWTTMTASMDVGKIRGVGCGDGKSCDEIRDSVPKAMTDALTMPRYSEQQMQEVARSQSRSRFMVRLKYRCELQLDKRLGVRQSCAAEMCVGSLTAITLLSPAVILFLKMRVLGGILAMCGMTVLLVSSIAIVVLAPVVWQVYAQKVRVSRGEAELHWFLTLVALEVRPHANDHPRSQRGSVNDNASSRDSSSVQSSTGDDSDKERELSLERRSMQVLQVVKEQPSNGSQTEAIRAFRLECALDSILGRPALSFFAIKQYFPTRFLAREQPRSTKKNGVLATPTRRVLLCSLHAVSWRSLATHNVCAANVVRHFLYLWEFMWSYQDADEALAHSELVLVLDCSGWKYHQWFSLEFQVMVEVLLTTHNYYPERLGAVRLVCDSLVFEPISRLVLHALPMKLRQKITVVRSVEAAMGSQRKKGTTDTADEVALTEFVCSSLATYGRATIPSFTRREIEQARRFATRGSLRAMGDGVGDGEAVEDAAGIGTRALLLPANEIEWETLYERDGVAMYRSKNAAPSSPPPSPSLFSFWSTTPGFQSDAQVAQWRGRLELEATDASLLAKHMINPKRWIVEDERLQVLQQLSPQEDISYWGRRVPFMSFFRSGHRGTSGKATTNTFFHTVIRRICAVTSASSSASPAGDTYTLLWKTTSAQRLVISPPSHDDVGHSDATPGSQWRKLDDPYVTMCVVIEPCAEREGSTASESVSSSQSAPSSSSNPHRGVVLHFWFQTLAPRASHTQALQIGAVVEKRMRALDRYVVRLEDGEDVK